MTKRVLRILVLVLGMVLLSAGWSPCHAFLEDPFGVSLAVSREGESRLLDVSFRVPEGHYLYAGELGVVVDGGDIELISAPDPVRKDDPFLGEVVDVHMSDFTLRYRLDASLPASFRVTVDYMGCDQEICFMPQSRRFLLDDNGVVIELEDEEPAWGDEDNQAGIFAGLEMTGVGAGFMNVADFLAFIERIEDGRGLERGRIEALVAGRGIWIGILAILLGGIALNLTPCVLPMIPINLAIIGAGSQAGSRWRGFMLGAVYGVGIALVYGVLGLVVVLTGSQFGALNASPWFNLAIAVLFVALGLAMFGVFNLDFTRFQTSLGGSRHGGAYATAFIFGSVAALLAGACVAPVVISVLVLATEFYQRGNGLALVLPFVLGAGMALPWPFAGAGMSFLPKPGRWMERIKIGFGILILIMAAYYGHLGAMLLRPLFSGTATSGAEDAFWMHSPVEAVAVARETGQPLFIDFWATWCKNCLAMDATTLRDPSVREALSSYVRLKYQAENLSDPETRRVLDSFGIRGLPAYVVLEPR